MVVTFNELFHFLKPLLYLQLFFFTQSKWIKIIRHKNGNGNGRSTALARYFFSDKGHV